MSNTINADPAELENSPAWPIAGGIPSEFKPLHQINP